MAHKVGKQLQNLNLLFVYFQVLCNVDLLDILSIRADVGGPKPAQVSGPKPGPSGWAQAGPKPEIWDPTKIKKSKFSKSKSVLPKMSARSGLIGKRTSRPHLGPSQTTFCVGRENPKVAKILFIFLGGPMGPIHPVWGHVLVSLKAAETICIKL